MKKTISGEAREEEGARSRGGSETVKSQRTCNRYRRRLDDMDEKTWEQFMRNMLSGNERER